MSPEKQYRSIAKCLTWRATALLDTFLLALVITGHPLQALTIGGIEFLTKSVLYYVHERGWLLAVKRIDAHRASETSWGQSHAHSVAKAVTWRFVGSIDTFVIALFVTGSLGVSAAIGIAELFTKTILYYLHERAWLKLRWGVHTPQRRMPAPLMRVFE